MKYSTRLVVGAVSLVLLTALTLVLVAGRWLRQDLEQVFAEQLEREVRIVAAAISARPPELNLAAHRFGVLTGRRITLMTPDGEVVGDSDFDSQSLQRLENHAGRPEVQAALEGRTGIDRRLSVSTNRVELKVAIRAWPGVVRVSASIDQVDAVVQRVSGSASVAAVVAVLAGMILAFFGSRTVARPVRQLAQATTAVAAGRDPDFPESSIAEIRELVRAFRAMHHDLEGRMADLRREREETATLIESMDEGVIATNERGEVVLCNGAMRRLLGLEPEGEIPNLSQLFYQRDAREVVDRVMDGRESPGTEVELEGRRVVMTGRPLPTGGAVLGVLDISDLRRLQMVRRDFVANVSHELQTPLTSILGYTETILSEEPDDGTRNEFLEVVHANGRRMQRLVDDLLDLARLESGAWSPQTEQVDIESLGQEAWSHLGGGDESSQPAFSVDVPEGLHVPADRRALLQVLTNLLDNARRHTPATGSITLRAHREADQVVLEVQDDGVGIPEEHAARVFERFYRVDPGRSRAEGGTGLGLAIVKHLIEGQGGDVELQSVPGRGTTVRVRLPAA